MMKYISIAAFTIFLIGACQSSKNPEMATTFGQDLEFLDQHVQTVLLKDRENGEAIIIPAWQGRVMTSSLDGKEGVSFGWINRELISSGQVLEHFNPYGGEDRFWLGPEGGQFSLYHKPGGPFTLDNWYVPKAVDQLPYDITHQTDSSVTFSARFKVLNYSGSEFSIGLDRIIRMISPDEALAQLDIRERKSLRLVCYESINRITNIGDSAWNREDGLVSIWILGMFNPSPNATIIIPFYQGGEGSLGPVVNDMYFGKVPPDRLHLTDGVIFFKGDGLFRSKIGLNWKRAKNVLGSYDGEKSALTVVQYSKPEEELPYIKSMWEIMDDPYGGDVINSYNDGPAGTDGKMLGPFYELETSSPVKELGPGEEMMHIHRTFHIQGNEQDLDRICEKVFGIKLNLIWDSK